LTIGLIIGSVIAAYAAVVSTLSLFLSVKAYRAGNPNVDVDWTYYETNRQLSLSVTNTGRADVTISAVDLYIVHERILRQSRSGKYFAISKETIKDIPIDLWWPDLGPETFPIRVASNSLFTVRVKSYAIRLPPEYPVPELLLKFVARFPGGKQTAYLRGDVLRHFVGIDPDRPITFPSPGSLPVEE
jgi:hypothetical protein